jgi:FlaA1/EpsC-like NDP-sugar epimerase
MKNIFKNSTILITGGTGSWGQRLSEQLLKKSQVSEVRIYSRGEQKQVEMKRKFQDKRIKYFIGDVRDKDRLRIVLQGVDYVFNLAALKHVPVCEENPWEAVQTNILGVQNLIEAAIENNVKKVIHVSTDKAVEPLNHYGICKACGEKLITAANLIDSTKFACFRAGNVTGTNGSAIPLFREQLLKLNMVTLTDPRMTRFLIRIEEAVDMLIQATNEFVGGEVFVMKTPACKIIDLVRVMADGLSRQKARIKVVGIRPGEKIDEILVSEYETSRTFEMDKYYVILPQIRVAESEKEYKKKYRKKLQLKGKSKDINSANVPMLSRKEIKKLLTDDGWLDTRYKDDFVSYLDNLKKNDLENFGESEMWFKREKNDPTQK